MKLYKTCENGVYHDSPVSINYIVNKTNYIT